MAGEVENLLQPHPLSLSELASLGDGGVAEAVWANFQPDLLAQAADYPVEARASQSAALPRPVNVDEERPRFRAPCLQPLPDGLLWGLGELAGSSGCGSPSLGRLRLDAT